MKKLLLSALLITTSLLAEPQIGDKALNFSLPSLQSDKTIEMKTKGLVLVNVWASWCKGCKKEMPFFNALVKKYKNKHFEIIAINIDKKKKSATKFLSKLDDKLEEKSVITFAHDKQKSIAKSYQAKGVPFSLLIKDGVVIHTYTGSFNEDNEGVLIKHIEAAL